jgi:transcriptional regulator with XRE-family HTH domain
MIKTASFFTEEMGQQLRRLRVRKGLSQAELALRMGLTYRSGKSFICRLEKGDIGDPHLSTITKYLRACGALFAEFYGPVIREDWLPVESEAKELMAKPNGGKPPTDTDQHRRW